MANDLQTLINAIPIAEPGHVITREYHNSLRAALAQLANSLGAAQSGQTVTRVFPPYFQANDGGPNWLLTNGLANRDLSGNANGSFPLNLPNGARIQSFGVTGQRAGAVATFTVRLLRVSVADGEGLQLVNIPLTSASESFSVTAPVTVPGAGGAALEEARVVDSSAYTYLVVARVLAAPNLAQIRSIHITYSL